MHHSEYVSEATGKRQFLHSRKKGCDAEIRVNAQLRRGVLVENKGAGRRPNDAFTALQPDILSDGLAETITKNEIPVQKL